MLFIQFGNIHCSLSNLKHVNLYVILSKTFLKARHTLGRQPHGIKAVWVRGFQYEDADFYRMLKTESSNCPIMSKDPYHYLMTTHPQR
jgi:hypothetical protein